MQSAARPPALYSGVNLVGDLYARIGLNEAARKLTVSLLTAGIDVSYCELPHSFGIERSRPEAFPEFQTLPKGYTHPINLLTHAITLAAEMSPEELKLHKQDRYTIPYWFWEFQQFPKSYVELFGRVDEIWVTAGYLRTAIEKLTHTPVRVVPVPVEFEIPTAPKRKRFGIPDDRFVFLFSFSALSSIARKNPFAVVKAFERAFADIRHHRPLLILKSTYMSGYPTAMKDLQTLLDRVGGRLIDENYSREMMNELLACADAYVSLHRCEGFGLGMAEAMFLGKPVIATSYSSNTDFMTEENSYLVNYQLRAVTEEDHFYQPTFKDIYAPGYYWAEPDIDHAAHRMREVYDKAEERHIKGQKAAEEIRTNYSYEAVGAIARQYLSAAEQSIVRTQGVNIIGDLYAEVGISEAARRLVDAIDFKNISLSYLEKIHNEWVVRPSSVEREKYALMTSGNIHSINLVVRNIGEMLSLSDEELKRLTAGKYTIAYWFWELEQLPKHYIAQIERVDEVWVASQHVQKAFLNASKVPVHVIPVPIELNLEKKFDRKHFGLPEDRFIFFFNFSAASGIARKNPLGVIDAFRAAFAPFSKDGPLLVLKVTGLDIYPQFKTDLQAKVDQVGGLLLGQTFSRDEMNGLLACIDVYISLHRAEGFGLGLAEAMYLGKPVIATRYSSNMDFMNDGNSYLVDYTYRPIKGSDHHYDPSMKDYFQPDLMSWAEPDLNQAAEYMRGLYHQPQGGLEKGKKAAETIRDIYSKDAVGNRILTRLLELLASRKTQVSPGPAQAFVTFAEFQNITQILHQTFHYWNVARLQENNATLSKIMRIPVLGRVAKFLARILRLKSTFESQAEFDSVLLKSLTTISTYLKQNPAFTHTIDVGSLLERFAAVPADESERLKTSLRSAISQLDSDVVSLEASVIQLQHKLDDTEAIILDTQTRQTHISSEWDHSSRLIRSIETAANRTGNEITQLRPDSTNQE